MTERVHAELALLRRVHPGLEFFDSSWVRVAPYALPKGWSASDVALAFCIPPSAAVQPYGFWIYPSITLSGGAAPTNYSAPVELPFGPGWGQFSWAPQAWRPHAQIEKGDNMLHFLRSIRDRLTDLQ